MNRLIFILYCYICVISNTIAVDRKLHWMIPCQNTADSENFVIIKADGDQDTLYYLWDYRSKPTFIITQVPFDTKVNFNCSTLSNNTFGSVHFAREPTFMFGVVFNKLYDFNDAHDTGVFNDQFKKIYNSEDFHWNVTVTDVNDEIPRILSTAVAKPLNISEEGSFQLKACAYTREGNAVYPPHLLHSINSSEIDLILDNFPTNFTNSRFASEFVFFSSFSNSTSFPVVQKTMDDEHTPGVFTLDTIIFHETETHYPNEGYLQYRPVVYTTKEKVVTSSTKTHQYNMADVPDRHFLTHTLLNAFYGNNIIIPYMKSETISFGNKGDKFYKLTNYSSWSFVVGIGTVPQVPLSIIVVIIMILALGVPLIIIVGGISLIIYERMKRLRFMSCLNPQIDD